jgi:hypothetical protein
VPLSTEKISDVCACQSITSLLFAQSLKELESISRQAYSPMNPLICFATQAFFDEA